MPRHLSIPDRRWTGGQSPPSPFCFPRAACVASRPLKAEMTSQGLPEYNSGSCAIWTVLRSAKNVSKTKKIWLMLPYKGRCATVFVKVSPLSNLYGAQQILHWLSFFEMEVGMFIFASNLHDLRHFVFVLCHSSTVGPKKCRLWRNSRINTVLLWGVYLVSFSQYDSSQGSCRETFRNRKYSVRVIILQKLFAKYCNRIVFSSGSENGGFQFISYS